MNHLYLAAAAQHATKWKPSPMDILGIRLFALALLALVIYSMVRTFNERRTVRAATPARTVNAEREYAGYETE